MTPKRQLIICSLIAMLILLVGCSPSSQLAQGSFTGSVEGTDAFVAVITNGRNLMAYVCDGETIAEWFMGELGDDSLTLVATSGANLEVTISNDGPAGTFTSPDGSPHSFKAALSTAPSGLYRTVETIEGTDYVGGWIILPDGQQRGAIKNDTSIFSSEVTNTDSLLTGKEDAIVVELDKVVFKDAEQNTLTPDFMDPEIDL